MPAHRVLPDADEILKMVRQGMTQQDIADEAFRRTGVRVTRAAVSAALARAGAPPMRNRYADLLPWRVKIEHDSHYALRMLRAEARQRSGEALPERESRRLSTWKRMLDDNRVVVHYDADTPTGFFYVPARSGIDVDLIRVSEPEPEGVCV